MNVRALKALYPNYARSVNETVYDAEGNVIEIDMDAINSWVDPEQYKYQRAKAYPSIADQLDQIYHEGIDAWKETIAAVKAEYPKP